MKYLLLVLLVGCAQPQQQVSTPSTPTIPTGNCKPLHEIWSSTTDSEIQDFRAFDLGFQFKPYSYIDATGANCTTTAKWFMITPQVNGASFEIHFQGACGSWTDAYILYQCTTIQVCTSNFGFCKIFQ